MPHALLDGLDDLRGEPLRARMREVRSAAMAVADRAAVAEIDEAGVRALRASARSYAALIPAPAAARRTLADLPAAATAGAARPAPMRRLPAPAAAAPAAPVPAPAPAAPRATGLAALRRPRAPEPEADQPEPVERRPPPPPGPVGFCPRIDPEEMRRHRARFGKNSLPYLKPDGTYNYSVPKLDEADKEIPF